MSEIEKMYENTIGKVCTHTVINPERCSKRRMTRCCGCDYYSYPPFTAEKQIELIKWFMHSRHFSPVRFNARWVVDDIAGHINFLWQNLTEEEKQQVKGILE